MMTVQNGIRSDSYDYIIFYRWLSPDGQYERGRIMARLVAEMLDRHRRRTWLDQHQMERTLDPKEVVERIADSFHTVSQVIILAAPGDWHRFANTDDIHRWEWELSLESDKTVWLLQYGFSADVAPLSSGEKLSAGLREHDARLAELAKKKNVHMRVLSMDSIDEVVKEIAEAQ